MSRKQPTLNGNSRCDQGFTLIEVLIAIAIFAIGFLAVGSMQISAINNNAKSRNSTMLVTIAKDLAEEMLALPYEDVELAGSPFAGTIHTPAPDGDGIDNDEDGEIDEVGETGHVNLVWNVIDDQPLAGTKSIRITVTRLANGSRRKASFDLLKANM